MASAAYERRDARARALGYRSYYDYRAHGNGARAPSEPRLSGESLARARGHRGASDLQGALRRGDVELINVVHSGGAEYQVLITRADGSTQSYTVRGQKKAAAIQQQISGLGPAAPKVVGTDTSRKKFGADDNEETRDEEIAAVLDALDAGQISAEDADAMLEELGAGGTVLAEPGEGQEEFPF
jgi:hypothetical protein